MAVTRADLESDRVPDLIEPFDAWRVWRVGMCDGRTVLKSLFSGTVWEPTVPLTAHCTGVQRVRWRPWRLSANDHVAPALGCRCGIYGVRTVAAARPYIDCTPFPYRDDRVIGRVALWGDVVEGKLGWRASHAYPVELFIRDPATERFGFRRRAHVEALLQALEAYRVPVEVAAPSALAVG
ncbi:MAG TPA: hypothetical protein VHZ77_00785 [Gaiellaceae bacterium]|jgi:hypothetical protein|nr:hypothetical protein [Gaiellaceae bacterium]